MTLRKEWREVVKRWYDVNDINEDAYDLALRLQALADKERRETFIHGYNRALMAQRIPDAETSYDDYLKSREDV